MKYADERWVSRQLTNVAMIADELTRPLGGYVLSIRCDSYTGAVRLEYQLDDDWNGDGASVARHIAGGLSSSVRDVRVEVYHGDQRWDAAVGEELPAAA